MCTYTHAKFFTHTCAYTINTWKIENSKNQNQKNRDLIQGLYWNPVPSPWNKQEVVGPSLGLPTSFHLICQVRNGFLSRNRLYLTTSFQLSFSDEVRACCQPFPHPLSFISDVSDYSVKHVESRLVFPFFYIHTEFPLILQEWSDLNLRRFSELLEPKASLSHPLLYCTAVIWEVWWHFLCVTTSVVQNSCLYWVWKIRHNVTLGVL